MSKVVIEACICGAEVTKEQNPAVPYTVEEIAKEAKAAYDAGAAVIHLHVREDDGTPTQSHERFQVCTEAILKECPDVILLPSTGGAVGMTDLERLDSTNTNPVPKFATLDCGTCNFGGDEIFVNSDTTIENFCKIFKERGIKPEIEVFDKGMVDMALRFRKKGLFDDPMHFNFVLGVQLAATVRDLAYCVSSIPETATWTGTGIGRYAFDMAAASVLMGGNVRIGFEDNLYIEKGVLAKSNGELVDKAAKIIKTLGREVATPDEAREIFSLK